MIWLDPPITERLGRLLAVGLSDDGSVGEADNRRVEHECFPDDEPIVIRMAPDWGAEVPLWPQSDDTDRLIPAPLLARLVLWQEVFLNNYTLDEWWRSIESKERWEATAEELEPEVREALRGKAELVVDLWPLHRSR